MLHVQDFFVQQIDYIHFLNGFSFIALAAMCFSAKGPFKPRIPWTWLGIFALIYGVSEWINLAEVGGFLPTMEPLRVCLRIASYIALVEFARRTAMCVSGNALRGAFAALTIAPSFMGLFKGLDYAETISGYTIGLIGGTWATISLLRASSIANKRNRNPIVTAAVSIACYTLISSIVGQKANFFPASTINANSFLHIFGFPVQIITALAGLCAALSVRAHSSSWITAELDNRTLVSLNKTRAKIFLFVTACLIFGGVITWQMGISAENDMKEEFLLRAVNASAALNVKDIALLRGTQSDLQTPAFKTIKRELVRIKQANSADCRFVYLMTYRKGKVVFLADAEPETSPDYSQPGSIYSDATPTLISALQSGGSCIDGPAEDNWGVWVSAIVPIRNIPGEKSLAHLGMDISANKWFAAVRKKRMTSMLVVLLFCIAASGLSMVHLNSREAQARIASSELHYRTLVDGSPNCVQLFDSESRCISINPSGLKLNGWRENEVIGRKLHELYPRDFKRTIDEAVDSVKSGNRCTIEVETQRPNGEKVNWRITLNPIHGEGLLEAGFVGIGVDITDLRRAEEKLLVHSYAIEATYDMVIITNSEGKIDYVNPAFVRETGYTLEEAVGHTPVDLLCCEEDKKKIESPCKKAIKSGVWKGEAVCRRRDGSTYSAEFTITPITNAKGLIEHLVIIKRDVTERKAKEQKLAQLAHHDPLTNLPNRLLFSDRLSHSIAQASRTHSGLSVMYFDLDGFKEVNDTFGHDAGDELLKQVAKRVKSVIRKSDTAARIGGDEFTVILEGTRSTKDAEAVAQKLLEALSQPFMVDSKQLHVTASIGISQYPDDGNDSESLVRNADAAMYRAKELGRNRFCIYSETINSEELEKVSLASSLRNAIERGEMVVYYQPVFETESGAVCRAEALVRWKHPRLGMIPPAEFIPLAEETGIIKNITAFVLASACKQIDSWHSDNKIQPITAAVNLTKSDIGDKSLFDVIEKALEESGVEPNKLALELTQNDLMLDPTSNAEIMERLKSLGIGISVTVEDSGCDILSLEQLKSLYVDTIKMSRSLISGVGSNTEGTAAVGAITAAAHSLGLTVIAEGVETLQQFELLRSIGCDSIQGYFIGHPMPASELTEILSGHRKILYGSDTMAA